jgi:fructose-1,6-bisphosphatase I
MTTELYLETYLDRLAAAGSLRADAAAAIVAITSAGREIAGILAAGPLAGALAAARGADADVNDWGDLQKELDIRAHDMMVGALRTAPVASVLSEEAEHPLILDPACWLAVAIDPLDGSSNIDTNAPVGTIFSLLPANRGDPAAAFLAPGRNQVAAGFMIYGVNTALVVTLGEGTHLFTLDRTRGAFIAASGPVTIPERTAEYAINGSNKRHWDKAVHSYVEDCVAGTEGRRGRNFNTRWIASLVAEAYRIMIRGGVYLYPADQRAGYREGRLRLIYEANPIAMLIEQAGGAATDGRSRILDLQPATVHQRIALVFGSKEEVVEIEHHYRQPMPELASPLFSARSLFRI